MLSLIQTLWKSLAFAVLVMAIFWLPKDAQDYDAAAKPWQKFFGMIDQNTALWILCLILGCRLIWSDIMPVLKARLSFRLPEQHSYILKELADKLAQTKEIALRYHPVQPSVDDRAILRAAFEVPYSQARSLIEQISYDQPTARTAKDFLHLCALIFTDGLDRRDTRTYRKDVESMSGPIFRFLHAGRSINRNVVPLPAWQREADFELSLVTAPGAVERLS